MLKSILTFCLGFALLSLAACNQASKTNAESTITESSPNIIYILADDMGYGDLSCYGQNTLSTPNIDRLAAQGMRFTQHYAGATVCAPSRASLLTGKQPGHSSVRGNQPAGQLIEDEEITIPEALKNAGYRSAVIGKWGVGHPPEPADPLRNGFDEAYGYINMWHAHNFYPEFLYKNAEKVSLEGNVTDWSFAYKEEMPEGTGVAKEKKTYVLDEFQKESMAFIENNQNNPFFLFLALNMPHANNEAGHFLKDGMEVPMMEKDGERIPNYGQFVNQDWPNPEKGFAMMMELIDNTVGEIEGKLEELGLSDKTIVIFTSDNGPHQEGNHKVDFFDSNGPLRGAKRDLYEGGIRVPMIVKWPGKVKAGSVSHHQSAFWDILPTFCEIARLDIPVGTDGISFLPTLLGQEQKQHDYLYWEFYEQGGRQAIRQGDWKYIKLNVRDHTKPTITELYNLKENLSEDNNVIESNPEIAEKLEALMQLAHQEHPLISLFSP